MIARDDLITGHLYRVRARSIRSPAVWDGGGFIGIRDKTIPRMVRDPETGRIGVIDPLRSEFLFREYIEDGVSTLGTVWPEEDLGPSPWLEGGFYATLFAAGGAEANLALFRWLDDRRAPYMEGPAPQPPTVRMQLRAAGSSHGWTNGSVSGPDDHPASIEDDDGTVYLAGWRDGTVGVWRQGLDSDELVQLCDLEVVRRWDVTVTRAAGRVDVRFALRG